MKGKLSLKNESIIFADRGNILFFSGKKIHFCFNSVLDAKLLEIIVASL
jgi:hypothetical protein